ncbi:MAG: ATP-binding cassette domain-containing protein [Granulosicoccus sp.]
MNETPISELNHTSRASGVCPVTARDISMSRSGRVLLSIPEIEFGSNKSRACCTVIVGPNGAGKSMLIRVLCNLLSPDTGIVSWAGQPPATKHRHRVGLMLQKPVLLRRSAGDNLVYALRQTGLNRARSRSESQSALEKAGLVDIASVPAQRLSGGEQQRLALVRALLLKPDILFLDEATANVDPSSTLVIEQQLRAAIDDGLSVVMVSHDQGQVKRMADDVLLLHKGQVIEHASRQQFFDQPGHRLTQRWIAGELLV